LVLTNSWLPSPFGGEIECKSNHVLPQHWHWRLPPAGVQADGYAVGGVAGTNGIGLDFTNCAD
jgi:hypothetical protein